MNAIFLLGRLIFGGYLIFSGVHHFVDLAELTQFAAGKGVPMAEAAVIVAGLLLLLGGLSIVLGWRPDVGIAATVLFLLGVSFPMHNFWAETGAARTNDFVNFTKNMALVGGALMFVAIPQPWPYSVGARTSVRPWIGESMRRPSESGSRP
jgi:uncharacterized membrane protein YphA (DoxX/SURF4 family)